MAEVPAPGHKAKRGRRVSYSLENKIKAHLKPDIWQKEHSREVSTVYALFAHAKMCIAGAQRTSLTKVLTLLCKTRKWCLHMATEHITGLKYFKIWKFWWTHTQNNMLMCLAQAIHIGLMMVTALRTLPISGLSSRLTRTRNGFRYAWWRSSTSASENFWCSISARPCFVLFLKPQIRILYTAQFDTTGCSTCKNSGIERKPVTQREMSTEKVSPPWIQDMPHVCSEVLPINSQRNHDQECSRPGSTLQKGSFTSTKRSLEYLSKKYEDWSS